MSPEFLDACLDAIASIRAALDRDSEASRILNPPDDDGTIPIAIPALTTIGATITMYAASHEGITTAEYLDRLTRSLIMDHGTETGSSDGGAS